MAVARSRRYRVEEVVPSAARTVASLRDLGYELPQAIADLVDNSIAAEATRVAIDMRFEGRDSWIRVADNGMGMSGRTLTEAMRYGTERDYKIDDLGRFGFGLKTASTSQCRRLTVASRVSKDQARFEARCLDLAHIEDTNRWEILVLGPDERSEKLVEPLRTHRGTVVLWEELDRVLEYSNPWGEWAHRRLLTLTAAVEEHLAMVFHRFLSGEVRGRRLTLTINGTEIEAWDPFCREQDATEALPAQEFDVAGDEGPGIVRVRPFVLPAQHQFSDETAWRRASGPLMWNRQQGFYIYRANRMIQSGGWSRMRTLDEHSKLARVALEFFPELDSAFHINVAKARVSLPTDLREKLDPVITSATRLAQTRYRRGSRQAERSGDPSGGPRGRSARGRSSSGRGRSAGGPRVVTAREALEAAAAEAGEPDALARIIRLLRKRYPEVADDLGW